MLVFIGRGIEYKSQDVVLQLSVRPHLRSVLVAARQEGCGGFGRGGQKRFAAWIRGCELYKERLDKLGLFSLEGGGGG